MGRVRSRAELEAGDRWPPSVSLQGLMLQDLVSAKLVSAYTVVEIPDCIHDFQATRKVRAQARVSVSPVCSISNFV